MTYDLKALPASQRYSLLASLVTPRPIAWVTTMDESGIVNAAPFSFFNVFGSNPPIVAFAPGNKNAHTPKDTARNIRRSREFVIHMVDESLGQMMVDTSASLPQGESELSSLPLTAIPSEKISVPRIAEAPVTLECTEHSTIEIGSNRMIIGEVHIIHTRDGLMDENDHLIREEYPVIGRMASPDWYTKTSDQFEILRPD